MKALETGGSEMEGVLVNQSQEGVVRLIGCLSDDREEVQNEVLLVLSKLTSSRNENIKTLVVFNDAFDKIFDMMQQVGGAPTTPRDAGLAVLSPCYSTHIRLESRANAPLVPCGFCKRASSAP